MHADLMMIHRCLAICLPNHSRSSILVAMYRLNASGWPLQCCRKTVADLAVDVWLQLGGSKAEGVNDKACM